jgi:uncharacterized protein (TIGR03083 family)
VPDALLPSSNVAVQVERCLDWIRRLSDVLADDLRTLSTHDWDAETNCPPWRVRDLAAHIVSSGEGFVDNIRRGLAGSVDPPQDTDTARRRRHALESADSATIAQALAATTAEFVDLYTDLSDAQLEVICFHRRGNRSVRWYAAHRLAEVAFHAWDMQVSLDRAPTFDEEVAGLLLPTLLESNLPRTYAAGLSTERGRGERYGLVVDGDPSARWLVTIDPQALAAERTSGPADLTIAASAATVALIAYGRVDLPTAVRSGSARAKGARALVDRFALIFPRP